MSQAATTIPAIAEEDKPLGLWTDALRRMRHSPAAIVGGSIVIFFVFMAIFAPFLAPYDPTRGNLAEQLPAARARSTGSGPTCRARTCCRASSSARA